MTYNISFLHILLAANARFRSCECPYFRRVFAAASSYIRSQWLEKKKKILAGFFEQNFSKSIDIYRND